MSLRAQPDRDLSLRPSPALWQGKSTALRIALGGHLRQLREANGITRDAAGYTIRASSSKISRLELGRVAFKERDCCRPRTMRAPSRRCATCTSLTTRSSVESRCGWPVKRS
ncbi:MAG: helix-turn-helix domain-containing protein [Pseudonocardiaceae bacterium]